MLSFLARREHSAEELRRKLKQSSSISKTADFSDLLERCLLEMQEKGFQSDDRFARQYVESKLANKSHGPLKILAEILIEASQGNRQTLFLMNSEIKSLAEKIY
ncbi:MAG: hypothetical protein Ct9H300mP28_17250 [Pseudomonadota bacterium]|nr:MAG: hypothetical protein Ct9H300mP28_17250 [Pseudomonadota bacterium]